MPDIPGARTFESLIGPKPFYLQNVMFPLKIFLTDKGGGGGGGEGELRRRGG